MAAVSLAVAASANAPGSSLRPVARGEVHPGVIAAISPRTVGVEPQAAQRDRATLYQSLRPRVRPNRADKKTAKRQTSPKRGSVCGDPAILGEKVGRVPGKISGCGVQGAVRVRSVSGVVLSRSALVDCTTAKALKLWVDRGLKPAVGRRGGGVSKMRVFASYSCRTRNNKKGAKISEHGKGRAVDIGAFSLRDGSEITVLKDWGRGKKGRILKEMHESACGPFGTVLGPKSDRYHKDHFHFDTARYRSGSYCR
ncbi:extensin family protein [Thalassovita sp.]|uniref:extensin-like domain-containing protein n=1 Tax=Thalassovita sp. TaxID=1979401 RepID=UPI002881FFC5|nr:extensin family protein [Thalassovita sp.]MDF1804629.1 extensin family protein [Thalassovita sp.]